MDEARKKTDKLLKDLERRVGEVYVTDPSLLRIQKRYDAYMKQVQKATESDYKAYQKETDEENRRKLKKAYADHVKELTTKSKQYKSLISEFSRVIASVNQKALDLVNSEMSEIYALNYNQMAVTCEEVGIEVNGEEEQ